MNIRPEELLKRKDVIEEINRHKWIESEKAGYDIGFEKATQDWLKRFSQEWIKKHLGKESYEPKPSLATFNAGRGRPRRS